jgi:hypothetical protein
MRIIVRIAFLVRAPRSVREQLDRGAVGQFEAHRRNQSANPAQVDAADADDVPSRRELRPDVVAFDRLPHLGLRADVAADVGAVDVKLVAVVGGDEQVRGSRPVVEHEGSAQFANIIRLRGPNPGRT